MTIVYAFPAGRPGAMDAGPGVQDAARGRRNSSANTVHDKLAAIGLAARTQGLEAMAAVLASDTRRYAGLVRELGLKLD